MKKCRKPKHKPYGLKRSNHWCYPHDYCQGRGEVSKKSARFLAKIEIHEELRNI